MRISDWSSAVCSSDLARRVIIAAAMLLLFVRQLEKLRLGGNARQHGRDRASVVSIGERPRNTLRPLPLRAVDPRTGRHARLTGRVRVAVPETVVNFRLDRKSTRLNSSH